MGSNASSFKVRYLLFSLKSSISFLRLLILFLVPSIFPTITCLRGDFKQVVTSPLGLPSWYYTYDYLFFSDCKQYFFFCTRSVQLISPSFSSTSFHRAVSVRMPPSYLHCRKITRKKFQSYDKGFPQNTCFSAIGNLIFLNMMFCANVPFFPYCPVTCHFRFALLKKRN